MKKILPSKASRDSSWTNELVNDHFQLSRSAIYLLVLISGAMLQISFLWSRVTRILILRRYLEAMIFFKPGLSPNTVYRVTVKAKNIRSPHFNLDETTPQYAEKYCTHVEFRTLPKGGRRFSSNPVCVVECFASVSVFFKLK